MDQSLSFKNKLWIVQNNQSWCWLLSHWCIDEVVYRLLYFQDQQNIKTKTKNSGIYLIWLNKLPIKDMKNVSLPRKISVTIIEIFFVVIKYTQQKLLF